MHQSDEAGRIEMVRIGRGEVIAGGRRRFFDAYLCTPMRGSVGAIGTSCLIGLRWLPAADVEADFSTTSEAVVPEDRVALISVSRFTEFVAGNDGEGRRAVTSLRVMCLREWLGERMPSTVLAAREIEVFAAGTTEIPVRFAGSSQTTQHSSKNYGGYTDWLEGQADEWVTGKLPTVKDPNLATVYGVTFHDVHVTAQKADVWVKVGTSVVEFKNLPLK